MEFFIGQNATLPLLKLQVVKDGNNDYTEMMRFIETSTIFFSMVNTENGIPKVMTRSAGFVEKLEMNPNASPEYYVYYRFTKNDTSRPGRYEGQFLFRNDTGTLVLPIREPLYINIGESYLSDDIEYNNCYTLEFPCCVPTQPSPTPTPSPTETPVPTPTPSITPSPTPTPVAGCILYTIYNGNDVAVGIEYLSCGGLLEGIVIEGGYSEFFCGSSIITTDLPNVTITINGECPIN